MLKKIFFTFCSITISILLIFFFSNSAKCAEIISGTGIEWEISNGILKLTYVDESSSSVIPNYSDASYQPWHSSRGSFDKVVIGSGITQIGQNAFHSCWFNSVEFEEPSKVTSIGMQAFASIFYEHPEITKFSGDFIIPEGVSYMGENTVLGGNEFSGKIILPSTLNSAGYIFCNGAFDNATLVFKGELNKSVVNNVLCNFWGHPNGTVYIQVPEEYLNEYTQFINTIGISATLNILSITAISDEPSPIEQDTPLGHTHDFVEGEIYSATTTTDGLGGIYCKTCGAIKESWPISAYGYSINDYATPMVNASKAGQTVTFELGEWNSFPKAFMEKIAAKSAEGVTFVFHYKWNHVKQEITISAGAQVDLNYEWYGPAKMAELYGAN